MRGGGVTDDLAQNERAAPGTFRRAKFGQRRAREAAGKRIVQRGQAGWPNWNIAHGRGLRTNPHAREFFGEELADLDNIIHWQPWAVPTKSAGEQIYQSDENFGQRFSDRYREKKYLRESAKSAKNAVLLGF